MSVGTSIEWTHIPGTVPATMNALVGCRKVSAGCKHCYAIGVAHVRAGNPLQVMQEKFRGTTERSGAGLNWTGKVTLSEKALLEPLRKRKPHTYFVNSMSDLFYEGVPDEWIDRHYAVFALCPQHTFIVLTKRPERMQKYLTELRAEGPTQGYISIYYGRPGRCFPTVKGLPWNQNVLDMPWPLPNVWHLVSVEDQRSADERIPLLLQTPSAVRGVSCEPLLGPVDLDRWMTEPNGRGVCNPMRRRRFEEHLVYADSAKLDWVICGGESGAGARPMHPDWTRGLRDQCQAAGVPFFFKQWGEWLPQTGGVEQLRTLPPTTPVTLLAHDGHRGQSFAEMEGHARFGRMLRVGKKAAGHLLDGQEWRQFPEVRA